MKLTYRGINYNAETSAIEIREGEMAGKYRGQPWYYHYPRHIPQLKAKLGLQYRGISYSKGTTVQSSPASHVSIPAVCADKKLPILGYYTSVAKEIKAEQVHIETMRRNLERRLSIAKESGNEELVLMLEKEFDALLLNRSR